MSGDVQPRKRKDKKRKRDGTDRRSEGEVTFSRQSSFQDDDESSHGVHMTKMAGDDVHLHVHHEHGTGGHWCAKLFFFVLLAILFGLIGLIIMENRGLTDLDTPLSESRFSNYFDGWVDEHRGEHDVVDASINQHEEHDEPFEEEEDHSEVDDDDDDDGDHEDEEGEEEAEEEDDGNATEERTIEETQEDDNDGDDDNDNDDDDDDDEDDENDDENEKATIEITRDSDGDDDDDDEGENENDATREQSIFNDNDDDDDDDDDNGENDDDEDDDDNISKNISKKTQENNDDDDDDDDDANDDDDEDNDNETNEQIFKSSRYNNNDDHNDNNVDNDADDDDDDDDDINETVEASHSTQKSAPISRHSNANDDDDDDDDNDPFDEEDDDGTFESLEKVIDNDAEELLHLQEKARQQNADKTTTASKENIEDDETEAVPSWASSLAVKIGIGAALALVARLVLIRKNPNTIDEPFPETIMRRRLTIANPEDTFAEDVHAQLPEDELKSKSPNVNGNGDDGANGNGGSGPNDDSYDLFEEELRRANAEMMRENYPISLKLFNKLIQKYPDKWEAFLGKAQSLDKLSQLQQSNQILMEAIEAYKRYLAFADKIPNDQEYRAAAERCIERMRFMGLNKQAVTIHEQLIARFNDEPKLRNELAVTLLLVNRLSDAKIVLEEVLRRWPTDGFAQVHYGFVLKQHDHDYKNAVIYLKHGIDSKAEGTQDGRFYFMLGDALQRLGQQAEALKVFERGAQLKLFPSVYQRSLYNAPNLRAMPYWSKNETTYMRFLEKLEQNWLAIRDEGLSVLSKKGYFMDEAESLRDTGDWKQFELYARGQRRPKNCQKAPITCSLIEEFKAASGCRRGQVKFSVMHPGTHVWPHCGPTNCRLRAHLGLVVPDGTYLRVANEFRTWKEGEFLIFDDSFEHEVWHNGSSVRLILIVDVWHPDLSEQQRQNLSPI